VGWRAGAREGAVGEQRPAFPSPSGRGPLGRKAEGVREKQFRKETLFDEPQPSPRATGAHEVDPGPGERQVQRRANLLSYTGLPTHLRSLHFGRDEGGSLSLLSSARNIAL
jgi:hypothetical protein